jgi:hypothetical protein
VWAAPPFSPAAGRPAALVGSSPNYLFYKF